MDKSIEKTIQATLLDIGIPANLLGFSYLTYAEILMLTNSEYMYNYKMLYVDIAKNFKTTPNSIESCIRNAIATCWLSGNKELSQQIFKNSVRKAHPTNKQFIHAVFFYLDN